MDTLIYKVKDSVDLFLSNESYLMAYYMNTRQRRSFKVNDGVIKLLETLDGKKNLNQIKKIMNDEYNISEEAVKRVIDGMIKAGIITQVVKRQDYLPENIIERYTRQINYFSEFLDGELEGILAQKKLMDSKIIIFGCGAVGGDIALELAMAGVQDITLFDYDVVEESDASRHMYYDDKYIGKYKVDCLAEELKKINSTINVNKICESMKPESNMEELICKADFVVNMLDEPYIGYTSSKISRICVKHNIPHFIAGGFDAHLASTGEIIIPYVTPCVECYAGHFKETLKDWKPSKHPVKLRYREIGGLASMSLFSASYAAIEIIKYIAGLVDIEKEFKVRGEFLFNDMSLTYLNVEKNPDCPICGGGKNEA